MRIASGTAGNLTAIALRQTRHWRDDCGFVDHQLVTASQIAHIDRTFSQHHERRSAIWCEPTGPLVVHKSMSRYRHARDPRAIGAAVAALAVVAAPAYMEFQLDDYLTWALTIAFLAALLVLWLLSR